MLSFDIFISESSRFTIIYNLHVQKHKCSILQKKMLVLIKIKTKLILNVHLESKDYAQGDEKHACNKI